MIPRRLALAALADFVLVLVFAGIGRASHDESNPVLAAIDTAWPFLVGAALGWALVLLLGRDPLRVTHAWPIWADAVVVGMLLRLATGDGTALPFVIVATLVLGAFLLGWRLVFGLVRRSAAA